MVLRIFQRGIGEEQGVKLTVGHKNNLMQRFDLRLH